jgi:D-alanyl-lipoteichoic acid acyltransferase DltB (MBOAT superfamily)
MQRADLPDYSLRIQFGSALWYRHLAAGGAVLNILLMMTANLVGFVLGIDGVRYLGEQLVSSSDGASRSCIRFSILTKTLNRLVLDVRTSGLIGLSFTLFSCICLFVAVQVMFEYRETEIRQGIQRRC